MDKGTSTMKFTNGYEMPVVGLGTWQVQDLPTTDRAVGSALDAGYRLIDTAFHYQNEGVIGDVLKRRMDEGKLKRDDFFITTKLCPYNMGSRERIRESFKESLESLHLDFIDLYLIHWPVGFKVDNIETFYLKLGDSARAAPPDLTMHLQEEEVDFVEVWKVLEELVDEGKIRSLGLSNFNSEQIKRVEACARHPISNLQIECHLYLQQKKLREFCRARGITVTAYGTFGAASMNRDRSIEEQTLHDPHLSEIARKHSKTPPQVLLRFLLQQDIAVIPKSVTPSRIKENLEVFDFELSPEDMAKLEKVGEEKHVRVYHLKESFGHMKEYPFNIPF